jgi:hypothetical protein
MIKKQLWTYLRYLKYNLEFIKMSNTSPKYTTVGGKKRRLYDGKRGGLYYKTKCGRVYVKCRSKPRPRPRPRPRSKKRKKRKKC